MEKLEGRDLQTREDIQDELTQLQQREGRSDRDQRHMVALQDALEYFPDQQYFLHHRGDKGGRERYAPIIGSNTEQIVDRMRSTGLNDKVRQHVPGNADIHGYRGEYATALYRMYARPIDQIPYDQVNKGTGRKYQSQVYACRKDEVGKKLDRTAMMKASKALGHNRLEVVANNYIRGL